MRSDILAEVRGLVIEAGKKIMPFYKGQSNVSLKKDDSPLTAADLDRAPFSCGFAPRRSCPACRSFLRNHHRQFIRLPLEYGLFLAGRSAGWDVKEFLKGTGEFTVNVALIEDGCLVSVGVVHAPVLMITYYASKVDGDAWRQNGGRCPESIEDAPGGIIAHFGGCRARIMRGRW